MTMEVNQIITFNRTVNDTQTDQTSTQGSSNRSELSLLLHHVIWSCDLDTNVIVVNSTRNSGDIANPSTGGGTINKNRNQRT